MKRMFRMEQMGLLFVLWAVCLPLQTAMALKVACVGDSHTYSGATSNPDVSYPVQLEAILKQIDDGWETDNFGVSGATVLELGKFPYIHQTDYTFPWQTAIDPNEYELALVYEPDVVVFQFGSNATTSFQNAGLIQGHFVSDYNALIETFAQLPSQPRIVICQPPPMFNPMYAQSSELLRDQIVPMVTQIAATWNAPIVDFYTAFQDLEHLYKEDKMHVTAAGAKIMAEMVAEAVLSGPTDPDLNGDGIVDTVDMHIMVDNWGQNNRTCDIAPAPQGDGIVDIQDLTLLAEYMAPVDTRLVTHWRLDETRCDMVNDTAAGMDGILKGNATWLPSDGMMGGALQLDGVDDYIEGPFILDPKQGPFSLCVWIKTSEYDQVIASQAGSGLDWLSIDASGKLATGLSYPLPMPPLTSDAIIADDLWHHIGLTTDGTSKCLYIDGVEVARDSTPIIMASEDGLNIGTGHGLEPDSFFTGLVDDVRVYNQALEPAEIAELAL